MNVYHIEEKWEKSLYTDKIFTYIYLLLLGLYIAIYFLGTTMFEAAWRGNVFWILRILILATVILKFAVTNKRMDLINVLLISAILVTFLVVWQRTAYIELYDTAFLILGAYNVDYKKVLYAYLIVNIPLTIITIFASQMGLVTNLIYNQNGRIRESFGFIYPTDFAAHIFFIFVAWVLVREVNCSFAEIFLMILVEFFLMSYSDTRCSEISIALLIIGCIFAKIKRKWLNKRYDISAFRERFKLLIMLFPALAAIFMLFLCRFYDPSNKILFLLNNVLSQRLKFGKKIFDYYDVQILGQYIEMVGNGGTTEKPEDYTFIDCSYMSVLMRFGLIVFFILLLIFYILMLRNWNNAFLVDALLLICVHSMIEHHLFEFCYDFFIILPLATFNIKNRNIKRQNKYSENRKI